MLLHLFSIFQSNRNFWVRLKLQYWSKIFSLFAKDLLRIILRERCAFSKKLQVRGVLSFAKITGDSRKIGGHRARERVHNCNLQSSLCEWYANDLRRKYKNSRTMRNVVKVTRLPNLYHRFHMRVIELLYGTKMLRMALELLESIGCKYWCIPQRIWVVSFTEFKII